MRNIRYLRKVVILFVKRFGVLIFLGVIGGGLIFTFYDKFSSIFPSVGQHKIGLVGRFTTENVPSEISKKISVGLTTLDFESLPQPGIAQSWEVKEDGRVWTFKIRQGLNWQDNSQIRSKDFKYKLPDVQVSYPSSDTIEFRLSSPYSPFPAVVSRPYFKKGLLGVGEWKVKNIVTSGGFLKLLTLEDKQGNREIYRFYETEQALVNAFKLAEIDTILEISTVEKLEKLSGLKISPINHQDRFIAIFFNTQDPAVEDKFIRQALAYAIKKTENYPRALSPISPISWAYNPLVKTYDYNTARAKEFLDKLPKEQRENFTIRLATIPSLLPIAEEVKRDWEAVGVKTEIQVATGIPENFQALLATQIIPPDPDQYALWHSTQTETNITRYTKSPRIDKILEDGRRTLSQDERRGIYLDFQRFLLEDVPAIFLYHPVSYSVTRK
ncbi:ABC transporter substrate-binding protein [Candidatus Microgenomates bacterium]|nr:ABC transporter substrate-binding protein [Candidatus Microgenomates bacterium]